MTGEGVCGRSSRVTRRPASADLGTAGLDLRSDASAALESVDAALRAVVASRARLGATQNRFEHIANALGVTADDLSASLGRIVDADVAAEVSALARSQVLQQVATAMLTRAGAVPRSLLALLEG